MTPPLLMLFPTYGRPAAASEAFASMVTLGTGQFDVHVLQGKANGLISLVNSVPHSLLSRYEIIGAMADDVRMRTQGWDGIVIKTLSGKVGLCYGRDGIQDERMPTHWFLSTRIILTLGYIMPPVFKHYCGDAVLLELTRPFNAAHYVPELFTEHLHHSIGKSPHDDTYESSERFINEDCAAREVWRRETLPGELEKLKGLFQ